MLMICAALHVQAWEEASDRLQIQIRQSQMISIMAQNDRYLLQCLRLFGDKEFFVENMQRPQRVVFLVMSHRIWRL